jgi:hypothetical protein
MSPAAATPRIHKTHLRSLRDKESSRYPATWSATNDSPRFPSLQQCELSLLTWADSSAEEWNRWHPEFFIQLDRLVRKSTPRNTVVFSGHRLWWLLSCGEVSLNLKTLQRRIIRHLNKTVTPQPIPNLEHSLIAQRIGKWSGSTAHVSQGLAGIFADLAAGESVLDSFALPFRRRSPKQKTNFDKLTLSKAPKISSRTQSSKSSNRKGRRRDDRASSSGWIAQPLLTPLGQIHRQPFQDMLSASH